MPRPRYHRAAGSVELKPEHVTDEMSTVIIGIGAISERADIANMFPEQRIQGCFSHIHVVDSVRDIIYLAGIDAGQVYRLTTTISKVSGNIAGRGRGVCAVGVGGGPNSAVGR